MCRVRYYIKHWVFLLWLAQIVTVSAKHVHTGHMRRFDSAQQETNVQKRLWGNAHECKY